MGSKQSKIRAAENRLEFCVPITLRTKGPKDHVNMRILPSIKSLKARGIPEIVVCGCFSMWSFRPLRTRCAFAVIMVAAPCWAYKSMHGVHGPRLMACLARLGRYVELASSARALWQERVEHTSLNKTRKVQMPNI